MAGSVRRSVAQGVSLPKVGGWRQSGGTRWEGMAYAPPSAMKSIMRKRNPAEGTPPDIERECETWDWARTAGVSAEELREAVREAQDSPRPRRSRPRPA
jgi:hypothetical protein